MIQIKRVPDILVVVYSPIGLIPLLGCIGPASCELNVPYVCFSFIKIL